MGVSSTQLRGGTENVWRNKKLVTQCSKNVLSGGLVGTKYWFAFPCQNLFQTVSFLPFYFNKAKEQICSLTQLFHYILKLMCLQHVQLRDIKGGGEGKRKPLWPSCALKSISLYFYSALKCFFFNMSSSVWGFSTVY